MPENQFIFKEKILSLFPNKTKSDFNSDSQRESWEFIENNDFPSKSNELWRNTDMRPLFLIDELKSQENNQTGTVFHELSQNFVNENALVFVNGKFSPEFSKISDNKLIHFIQSDSANNGKSEIDTPQIPNAFKTLFTELNHVFSTEGYIVQIPENTKIETPIHIVSISDNREGTLFYQLNNTILCGKNSEAEIYIEHVSSMVNSGITNSKTSIVLHENASLNITQEIRISDNSFHFETFHAILTESSTLKKQNIAHSGKIIRNDHIIELSGENAIADISGLSLPKQSQTIDNHVFIQHQKPHCSSRQLFKTIVSNKAQSVFRGRVFVCKDAQKTDAYQSSKSLLLSESAKSYSRPQLEIYADDVKCSHGSTSGQLDENSLFYMKARGISEKTAKSLLIKAFAAEVISKIPNESTRQKVESTIEF